MFNLNLNSSSLILAEQSDWQKNAYHLGHYDYISNGTIYRRTAYIDLSKRKWEYVSADSRWQDVGNYIFDVISPASNVAFNGVCNNYETISIKYQNDYPSSIGVALYEHRLYIRTGSSITGPCGILEYQTTMVYEEPLTSINYNLLDETGSNWLRAQFDDSANVFTTDCDRSYDTSSCDSYSLNGSRVSLTYTNNADPYVYFLYNGLLEIGKVYTVSVIMLSGTLEGLYVGEYGRGDLGVITESSKVTFRSRTGNIWLGVEAWAGSGTAVAGIMINEGNRRLPYKDHVGTIVRASSFINGTLSLVTVK